MGGIGGRVDGGVGALKQSGPQPAPILVATDEVAHVFAGRSIAAFIYLSIDELLELRRK